MTNTQQVKSAIVARGLTQAQAAKMIGLSPTSFNYKINNRREFKASEIEKLCDLLGITDVPYYFFTESVDYKATKRAKGGKP